jgi:hypothetical protein
MLKTDEVYNYYKALTCSDEIVTYADDPRI